MTLEIRRLRLTASAECYRKYRDAVLTWDMKDDAETSMFLAYVLYKCTAVDVYKDKGTVHIIACNGDDFNLIHYELYKKFGYSNEEMDELNG